MKTSVLKPGFLVSLKTTLRGGVIYQRAELETEHQTEEGALRARWETTKEITDPNEFKRGTEARGLARATVGKVCAYSPNFGFMAPIDKENELAEAVELAREIARDYNRTATTNQLTVSVITGRIAQNDVEAARAIGTEIRELLDAMRDGIANADATAIREAANKARALGAMLTPDVGAQVSAAIIEARAAARAIVSKVEKAGATAADVVAQLYTAKIDAARFSFLDLDGTAPVTAEAPAGRSIDLQADEQPAAEAYAAPNAVRALELF